MTNSPYVHRLVTRPVERTQCSWIVQGINRERWFSDRERGYLREKGMNFELCPKWSTHVIGDNYYCTQHAGVVALKILNERALSQGNHHGKDQSRAGTQS